MVSIGICGASGCGKTLLVKQLAAKNCAPALLEGELGTFPPKIIHEIKFAKNPVVLFEWFTNEYMKRLKLAAKLSSLKMLCFVDGCAASIPAHKILQKPENQKKLEEIYTKVNTDTDVIVLLTLSPKGFEKLIKLRGRKHELDSEYISRSTRVQNEFLRLLKGKKNVLVLRRDALNFQNHKDINKINKKIISFSKIVSKK